MTNVMRANDGHSDLVIPSLLVLDVVKPQRLVMRIEWAPSQCSSPRAGVWPGQPLRGSEWGRGSSG